MPYLDYEKQKAASLASHYRNREHRLKYMKEYREVHSDEMALYKIKWSWENRDRYRAQKRRNEQNRRARKLGQFVEDVNIMVLLERDSGCCGICGEFVDDDVHIDHIVPLCQGGEHSYKNTQPAHPSCNLSKPRKG